MGNTKINQIGIIGGGISAIMLCNEAAKLGIKTTLLDPAIDCIGSELVNEHIIGAITPSNIEKLSLRCDVLIFNQKINFKLELKTSILTLPSIETLNTLYDFRKTNDLLEDLEIPVPDYYCQDANTACFNKLDGITLPLKLIKNFDNHCEEFIALTPDDLADFILETGTTPDSFIIAPIQDYKYTVTFICTFDSSKKFFSYEPTISHEVIVDAPIPESKALADIEANLELSKTMINRLNKYNKKLLQSLDSMGCYTIKYGITSNKSPVLIDVSPEIDTCGLITNASYDVSIYKQVLYMIYLMILPKPEKLLSLYGYRCSICDTNYLGKSTPHFVDLYNIGNSGYYIKDNNSLTR